MIVGHAVVALWVKARRPAIPIALLMVATYFADLAEAWLYWTHLPPVDEHTAHEIPTLVVAAALFGIGYGAITRRWPDAFIVSLVVVSHWVLDFVTGLKPTWPGGPLVGLCVYRSHMADFVLESLLVGAAWFAINRRRGAGRWGDARLYPALIVVQLGADILGAITNGGRCAH